MNVQEKICAAIYVVVRIVGVFAVLILDYWMFSHFF